MQACKSSACGPAPAACRLPLPLLLERLLRINGSAQGLIPSLVMGLGFSADIRPHQLRNLDTTLVVNQPISHTLARGSHEALLLQLRHNLLLGSFHSKASALLARAWT